MSKFSRLIAPSCAKGVEGGWYNLMSIGQGTRIVPTEYDDRDDAEADWRRIYMDRERG